MIGPRFERLQALVQESNALVDQAIATHITGESRRLAAICVLFSGGDDSTVLAHLLRQRADYAVHINTGIGIEATREYVRQTCRGWDLPLIEEHPPPGCTYEELVLDQGFPGPGHHYKMYQRLKERGLRKVRKRLVPRPRQERVLFVAGRRRDESQRRMQVPEMEREGAIVWVSPLVNWTKRDLNTYRMAHRDVPRNPVSATLHMSGECLCGAFAHEGELDEIGYWYPDTVAQIRELESKVAAAGHPPQRCIWGWGGSATGPEAEAPSASGPLCTSCDARFEPASG